MRQPIRAVRTLAAALTLLLSAVCLAGAEPAPLSAFVSILPQKDFVERIGGPRVDVSVMVAPGASPASYEPKPRQMVGLSEADLYFAVGVPFEEAWLPKFTAANPNMRVVSTQEGIEKVPMAAHRHGEKADHRHHGRDSSAVRDPHIWLSPPLVLLQGRHILTALVAADPDGAATYEENFRTFAMELVDLDRRIRNLLADRSRRRFMVFHPSWGYFARAYGLEQVPVEVEGKDPKPAELQRLIRTARDEGIRAIFVQPQFSSRSAEVIADAIDGRVVEADPLAPDWADNLMAVADRFRKALE